MSNESLRTLYPVSMNLLYEGLVAPQDIYNYNGTQLLVRQGTLLTQKQIDAIRGHGSNGEIRVTRETRKVMMSHILPGGAVDIQSLEKDSGYTESKDVTLKILNEIESTSNVPEEAIYSVREELSGRLEVSRPDVILDIINAMGPADEYLQRHSLNVSMLNGLIGKWMGYPKEYVDTLILVGMLHDCGKAALPTQVLSAPRALTVAEFEVIKMHPVHAYNLLCDFPEVVRRGVRGHHEKVNGTGYPDRLVTDAISLESRITAISDVYDAMVSRRSYKVPQSPFHVMAMLGHLRGTDLDTTIVDVFTQNIPKELLGKPAMLSNGEVGVIHQIDPFDPGYPYIKTRNEVVKSNKDLYCLHMYFDND
jgi:HD-GYP domain-containing protein (c-di-GMP phosphodiesterase class II)